MKGELVIIIIYALIMAAIGIVNNKHSKGMKEFMLGSRKAGAWMSAFAYGTTYFSAVVFIGYAGRNGMGFGLWAVLIGIVNAIIGSLITWKLLAKPTRRITHKFKLGTMPEFFNVRYKDPVLKIAAAVIIFIFMTP